MAESERPKGEVHARRQPGEIVLNPHRLQDYLHGERLDREGRAYARTATEIEVRTATPDQEPPYGAVWLTAVDADVSLKADPMALVGLLQEAGILEQMRRDGRLDFLS